MSKKTNDIIWNKLNNVERRHYTRFLQGMRFGHLMVHAEVTAIIMKNEKNNSKDFIVLDH